MVFRNVSGINRTKAPEARARGNPLRLEADETSAQRVDHGFNAVAGAQFAVDAGEVIAHGLLADAEQPGHLLVGQSEGHLPQHLELSDREVARHRVRTSYH